MPVPFANLKQSVQAASLPVNTTALSCDGCYCRGQPYPIGKYGKTFPFSRGKFNRKLSPMAERGPRPFFICIHVVTKKADAEPSPFIKRSDLFPSFRPHPRQDAGKRPWQQHGFRRHGSAAATRECPPSMRNRREEPAGINRAPSSSWAAPVRPGDADKKQPRRKSSGAVPLMFTN